MNEQLTETLIQTERFIKKFKIVIIVLVLAVVGYFAFTKITTYQQNAKLEQSNEIYLSLILNQDEQKEKELLNLNPNLYSIYLFYTKKDKQGAILAAKDEVLKNIYKADEKDSRYLKDLSYLKQGYEFLKQNDIKQANEVLNNITADSMFFAIAKNLKHYQGK